MSATIIKFPKPKYGVDYIREEMERHGAEYIDHLLCNNQDAMAWLTTKGVLYIEWDEVRRRWVHEWRVTAAAEEMLQ
jgi:hypothetical protein